ncbi:chaplin [Streptomyces sp. NPDC006529]|uniref:chaplin n=1 Tax=Streptomyces sp. NPDC006529 TaxID=3157177 RepID=UPI0033A726FE
MRHARHTHGNQGARKTLITVAAAGGMLALGGGYAHADGAGGGGAVASGHAAGSPGLLSGNALQAPVDAPVNLCGNTVTVVGALNPAFGAFCANNAGKPASHEGHHGGNPGTPGGHHGQNPGTPGGHGGNPGGTTGTGSGHGTGPSTGTGTGTPVTYPGAPSGSHTGGTESLAATGAGDLLGGAVPLAAGMLLAGAVLYRRARNAA